MRLFTGSLGGTTAVTIVDVLIISGQSNARGNTNGVVPIAPYLTPNINAYMRGEDIGSSTISSFLVMDYNANGFLGITHGAETSFAENYGTDNVYVIKVVKGDTSLDVDWASGSTNRNKLIAEIQAAKTFFITNNITVSWGWYWNQWEKDCQDNQFTLDYEANYQDLVDDITSTAGITIDNHIIAKVNINGARYAANTSNCDTIITSQNNNATLYGADVLSLDDLTLHDSVHYTSVSQNTIGTRIYDLINP